MSVHEPNSVCSLLAFFHSSAFLSSKYKINSYEVNKIVTFLDLLTQSV